MNFRLPVAVVWVAAALGQSPQGLWVLQPPDEIVEYDLTLSSVRRTLKVPRRLAEHPEYLSINARGQMVFLPPRDAQWASGEMASAGGRVWIWDGRQAQDRKLEGEWFLSAGGESFFRFENRFQKVTDASGLDISVRSSARVSRTDLVTGKAEAIASLSSPGSCPCTTGTCSESCPEWYLWAPDGVVGDFFLVTRFTPGQLQPTYHDSALYRRSGPAWQVRKLPEPIERPLTASATGDLLIETVPDAGCCGWENESSDQLLLLRNGKASVLFDEFDRFNNRNYDVSFYAADARLSPGDAMLAYTIVSTAGATGEIRLSSGGKENPDELARVRKAIAGLPAVEVVQLGPRPRSTTVIPHAGLVGWTSAEEILVAQDGRLTVYDSRGVKRRETPIRVRTAADAFLR